MRIRDVLIELCVAMIYTIVLSVPTGLAVGLGIRAAIWAVQL